MDLTAWSENHELSKKYGSIRLAQGAPVLQSPTFLTDQMAVCLKEGGYNQYPPSQGVPALIESAAKFFSPYIGRPLGHENVMISLGAIQGLTLGCLALLRPGDEVIVLEPCFC